MKPKAQGLEELILLLQAVVGPTKAVSIRPKNNVES